MLKNKILPITCCIVLLLSIFACSSSTGQTNVGLTPDDVAKQQNVESPQNFTALATVSFQKGESSLQKGDLKNARIHFDHVIDILMEAGDSAQLESYITRISSLELAYLEKKPQPRPNVQQLLPFIDEKSPQAPANSFPITVNSRVAVFIKAFRGVRKKNIQNALNRSVEYIDDYKKIFRSYGLPEELAYLPMIESGFRVNAVSRARACGIWQFISSTARLFGLRVDWVVDERSDPYKSAHAAAKYLKHLYKEYGDYYLALACYNGGPRRINLAIKRLKTKDFFKIAKTLYIRRETRNYVPQFLAALIIAKNPETYGFSVEKLENIEKRFANSKLIEIPSPVSMKEVADVIQVPYAQLQHLNPHLIQDFTPFDSKKFTIRVPENVEPEQLADLKRLPPAKRFFVGWYQVRRGDSLYSIARKFRTSVNKIKKANKLRNNMIHPGKRLIIPRG